MDLSKVSPSYKNTSNYAKNELNQNNASVTSNSSLSPLNKDTLAITAKKGTKKGLTKGEKITIMASVLTTLSAVGVFLVSRGREKKALKKAAAEALKEIPEELRASFHKLQNEEGESFIHKAYSELVDFMGLKGIAPEKVKIKPEGEHSITGGFDQVENTIEYTQGFLSKASKQQQISLLSHELKHCRQFTNIMRTEGIGVEKYAEAIADNNFKALKEGHFNIQFQKAYKKALENGTLEEFTKQTKQHWIDEITEKINSNFSEALKLPKISADSVEGKEAIKHLEAMRNYEGLGITGMGTAEYRNNPLELEAYDFGDKISKYFQTYGKYAPVAG